jgi:2-C-methyl-D-erythritol 4-phosphate cytidylyltransferase/2-C-methyl-D-erythritol 2,4-cyclodiphosphate synthase
MARIAALIVGAGSGSRLGAARPKQYLPLVGISVIRRALDAFEGLALFVQPVIGAGQEAEYRAATKGLYLLPPVTGGATRAESVRAGLEALASHEPDYVLIHDAARPLVSQGLIARVIAALESGARAAVPMIAVADTLRKQDTEGWETIPRDHLFRAQTPQGFAFDAILNAHREYADETATDDMALAELAGIEVIVVAGEQSNITITTEEDMAHAARLLGGASETRTGSGFDAHRFTSGDHVWLCGVKIAHTHGLEGHSDADCGLHALTDALLGAISAGDIGQHFPPMDEKWRGAPSSLFLAHAASLVREDGGAILNCVVTIVCESPKLSPHREAMRAAIADILKLDISRISVKATTTEGMGFTGRREGIAAQAIATIERPRT